MKYCIYHDRQMSGTTILNEVLPGCEIFGVHHNCEGCPNLKDMGDCAYNAASIKDKGWKDYIK